MLIDNKYSKLASVSIIIMFLLFSPRVNAQEFEHFMGVEIGDSKTYEIIRNSDEDGFYVAFDRELQESIYLGVGDQFTITVTDPNPVDYPSSAVLSDFFPTTQFEINYTIEFEDPKNSGNTLSFDRTEFVGFGQYVTHVNWSNYDDYFNALKESMTEALEEDFVVNKANLIKDSSGNTYEVKLELSVNMIDEPTDSVEYLAHAIHEKSSGFLLYSNLQLNRVENGTTEEKYEEIKAVNFKLGGSSDSDDPLSLDFPIGILSMFIIVIPIARYERK